LTASEKTGVRFCSLTDDEITRYVNSGEGRDKAGSYGVQGFGAALVESIDGCYYNVVGLPVALLFHLLKKAAA
jgi:septum formation protein